MKVYFYSEACKNFLIFNANVIGIFKIDKLNLFELKEIFRFTQFY